MAHLKVLARETLGVAVVIGLFGAASCVAYQAAAAAVSLSAYFGG